MCQKGLTVQHSQIALVSKIVQTVLENESKCRYLTVLDSFKLTNSSTIIKL